MKARIINTPVEVEVIPYFPEGMFAGFTDVSGKLQPGMIVYKTSDLEFIDKPEPLKPTVDLDAYRREAAKDILCAIIYRGILANEAYLMGYVNAAVEYADALIAKLKEK